ncbi:MAG: DUF1297 domain-containing protein [Candidatus Micrarchaeia archaeon]
MVLDRLIDISREIKNPTVATLGSHSALDICEGAKSLGLKTLVAVQKGREYTYKSFYMSRKRRGQEIGCIDRLLELDKFAQIADKKNVDALNAAQAVFVPHRSFSVYVGYDRIENDFEVPIFGSRMLLRAEERAADRNQYYLLEKAGIRVPLSFKSPDEIDRLVIVKAPEAKRSYERAFFFASSPSEYRQRAGELVKKGIVTKEGVEGAKIEEFVLGAQYNFNFFYSPLNRELEFMGTDMRRQTNLDGVLRLPANEQMNVLDKIRVNNIEVGHVACTVRESLLEAGLRAGEKLVKACKAEYPPGIIGPFALQGAITSEKGGEDFVVFDVSFRQPGSPGIRFTPYTGYLYGKQVSMGQRIAIEVLEAAKAGEVGKIIT